MKKIIYVLVCTLMLNIPVYAQTEKPKVAANGAVLMDAESGRVLWGKNEETPMAMASTTKIMTAILAIEHGNPDDEVTVSKRASQAPEVNMNLQEGEVHKLQNLLYALMLQSFNDSAIAIAEHIGGSVEGFAEMMNDKAAEIGAKDTVFVTPNGLDAGDHHSTAEDMALITRYALQNEEFVKLINTPSASFNSLDNRNKSYNVVNKNRLLSEYQGAIGVKTGFTGKAGQCFVGAAERDGITMISVVLASGWGGAGKEKKWQDTKAILNYGFDNYKRVDVIEKGKFVKTVPVLYCKEGSVDLILKDGFVGVFTDEELKNIKIKTNIPKDIEAPVNQGDKYGSVDFILDDEVISSVDVVAKSSVQRHDLKTVMNKIINGWLKLDIKGIM